MERGRSSSAGAARRLLRCFSRGRVVDFFLVSFVIAVVVVVVDWEEYVCVSGRGLLRWLKFVEVEFFFSKEGEGSVSFFRLTTMTFSLPLFLRFS